MKILFSCVGTSDPFRGLHDGPLLHILRHYRPDEVFVFLTKEIIEYNNRNGCTKDRMISYFHDKLNEYAPFIELYVSNISDPSDLDTIEEDIKVAFQQCIKKWPGNEILVNISSGTPQMQIILSQLALDIRYPTKAIQVKNPERRAGTAERTNDTDYYLDYEEEFNKDDHPDTPNRCVEPKMYPIIRENRKNQILSLLEMRDFQALHKIKDSIPGELHTLIDHLAERSLLQGRARNSTVSQNVLGFSLYPERKVITTGIGDYVPFFDTVEYAMLFRNLEISQRYTEYLLRMEPLITSLMKTVANRLLWESYKCELNDFIDANYRGVENFNREELSIRIPPLYNQLLTQMGEIKNDKLSVYLLDNLIMCLGNAPCDCSELFAVYEKLKEARNGAAHELTSYSEQDIQKSAGISVHELTRKIEKAVVAVYPQCVKERFEVYDNCVDYIKNKL